MSVVLALVLVAGSAFAGYGFLTATLSVEVEEAIAVGMFDTWDNLEPYGSVDDVNITLGEDGGNPTITISTTADTPYVGEGFTAGEWIVIPVNIRNGSDAPLTLTASVTGSAALILGCSYELNVGAKTDEIPAGHEGDFLAYNFKAQDEFTSLDNWSEEVAGNSGFSGSAVHNAQVLFIKISAPGDVAPGSYTCHVKLERS